jgi:hypothetical protein
LGLQRYKHRIQTTKLFEEIFSLFFEGLTPQPPAKIHPRTTPQTLFCVPRSESGRKGKNFRFRLPNFSESFFKFFGTALFLSTLCYLLSKSLLTCSPKAGAKVSTAPLARQTFSQLFLKNFERHGQKKPFQNYVPIRSRIRF